MSSQTPSSIINELSKVPAEDLADPRKRQNALALSKQLTASLEDPINTATDMVFSPFIPAAVRIAVSLNLFAILSSRAPNALTTQDLASACEAEELLVQRIARVCASVSFIADAGPGLWGATPITHAMAKPEVAAGHRMVWDLMIIPIVKGHLYLEEETSRSCPVDPGNALIQFAHGTKAGNAFEYMAIEKPEMMKDFHLFMGSTMGARTYWVDWFPVQKYLLDDFDSKKGPLLVDIGGGKGHDLQAFCDKYPNLEAKFVLQDLDQALSTVEKATLDPRITLQEQDFFTPNLSPGAKAYFLHHILHDWSHEYALGILAQVKAAMTPGYSKLLIHELVLPDQGVSAYQARWDMTMMTFNAGIERNRTQWKELLEQAGFEVVGFFHGEDGEDADGVVLAELKQ